MWPSQRQMVTSLILHGKELPWTVFISSWSPGDGARQKRDMSKFGCWEVSSLQVRYPLQGFQRLSNPRTATWRDGELSPFQAPWWFPSGRTSSAPRVTHTTCLFLHLSGSDSPCPFQSGDNLLAQSSGQLKDPAPFLLAVHSLLLLGAGASLPLTHNVPLPWWQSHSYAHVTKLSRPTLISRQALRLS